MTTVEKVLAAKSGKASVRPGDVVFPDPDYVMIYDGVVMGAKRELDSLGINRLAAPDKVMMVSDHDVGDSYYRAYPVSSQGPWVHPVTRVVPSIEVRTTYTSDFVSHYPHKADEHSLV